MIGLKLKLQLKLFPLKIYFIIFKEFKETGNRSKFMVKF